MKVYVVTEGDYSDYHIVGVCTSQESAKRIQQIASGDYHEAKIEEYEADKFNIKPTYNYYGVSVYKNGSATANIDGYIFEPYEVRDYCNAKHTCAFSVDVFAQDEEHAKKIAFDLIAEYKAKEKGIAL